MPDPTTSTPPRKGRGCLFYGCLTCVVLLLIMAVLAVVLFRFVKNQVNAYTDSQPMKLPRVEMTDAEYQQLGKRVKSFGDAMEKGTGAEPLLLTERDINALITKAPNMK